MKKQEVRHKNTGSDFIKYNDISWFKRGLKWGIIMFVLTTIVRPLIQGEKLILLNLCTGIVIWTLSVLFLSYHIQKTYEMLRVKGTGYVEEAETENK